MRTQRGLTYVLALTSLLGLAFAGWTHIAPVSAQADPNQPPPGGPPPFRMGMGPSSVAASGDYVYVLRGGTLFQFKAADLTINKQIDVPAPGAAAPAGAGAANSQ